MMTRSALLALLNRERYGTIAELERERAKPPVDAMRELAARLWREDIADRRRRSRPHSSGKRK